ncbi:MAG: hypothetical protein HUK26_03090, partial [Duodenibacillus sp.]|nr:hypothetical protein [Duodenibacillus sp.]
MLNKPLACLAAGAIVLAGCASTVAAPAGGEGGRHHYSAFTDATWLPETTVRSPLGSREIRMHPEEVFEVGVSQFDGIYEGKVEVDGGLAAETRLQQYGRALGWTPGSGHIFRNSQQVANPTASKARMIDGDRMMFSSTGEGANNVAIGVRAFDIAGKPVFELLRDANNQPAPLAWYMDRTKVFPSGSIAYQFTYWLAQDEIVRPKANSFTG